MLDTLQLPYVQRGMVLVLVLSIGAGLIGTWVVLRGLAFFTHAAGTAAFPGLVLADAIGFPAPLAAFGCAAVLGVGLARLSTGRRRDTDSATALVLVGALVVGIILASDVFHSGASVDTLLFGSLLLSSWRDVAFAGAASAVAIGASTILGPRWLTVGFAGSGTWAGRRVTRAFELTLVLVVGLLVAATLTTTGALLATGLLVVPAATTRPWFARVLPWQAATILLVAAEGVGGLWLSVRTNAPPGALIATLGGAAFALSFAARAVLPSIPGRKRGAIVAVAASIAVAGAACGGSAPGQPASGGTHRIVVVATTTQIADWVRNVAGARADVHQILQPNTDPHEYEPRPGDVASAARASVVFENGDNLDRWMNDVISEAGGHAAVVVLGDGVPIKLPGEATGPEASTYDPHWWHDPRNAEAAVGEIRDALIRLDPPGAPTYRQRAASYIARLQRLDASIASCIDRVPADQRTLVTDHDAFSYFANRYGIEVIGAVIPSQTTQSQPSARQVADLIATIRREHVRAIFPESSVNPKLAKAIARETGATSSYTLYGDTLGPAGSAGATYLSMEAANAEAMAEGFSGGTITCSIQGAS